MPLSDPAIKKAKPGITPQGRITEKPYKLTDERGLYLLVSMAGKYWRMNYRFDGKQKTLALGVYPDVSLARAREKRGEAHQKIADGIDPGELKKATKTQRVEGAANSFEVVTREWYAKTRRIGRADMAAKSFADSSVIYSSGWVAVPLPRLPRLNYLPR